MTITKNQVYELTITGMTAEGSGVGHITEDGDKGLAVFVPFTAVGDRLRVRLVKVKKRFAYGIIEELLVPSPDRLADSGCAVYGKCGGCVYRHVSYDAEQRYKAQRVKDAFARIGGLTPTFHPLLPSPAVDGYRNKAQFPVTGTAARPLIGFYAPRSHRVIPCCDCALQPPVFKELLDAIAAWMSEANAAPYDERTHTGLVRHLYIRQAVKTGQLMVCLVCTSGKLPQVPLLLEKLRAHENVTSVCVNINRRDTNVILGDETFALYGDTYITDELCGLQFQLSPRSFYQVNHDGAERLYTLAADAAALNKDDILLDLYCGTGTIGLSMAHRVRSLIGVEIVVPAVEDARRNAARNGIDNARFLCADAADAAKQLEKEGIRPTVIVVDPPRKGCDKALIETIARMAPDRVVYVSCDPATLARDCAVFEQNGYAVSHVTPVDMFPRTAHVETVALLSKLCTREHIDIELDVEDLDLTAAEKKATYQEIKDYVLKHSGLKVTTLNIAQVKQQYGIIERECYNKPKSDDARQPHCPPEKEAAIVAALKHFGMI